MNVSFVTKILETAECLDYGGYKCFLVSLEQFSEVVERLEGQVFENKVLTTKHHLENVEIRLSSVQEGSYYLVAKSEPILDTLWKKKFKEPR
jgi:hypothetical protein